MPPETRRQLKNLYQVKNPGEQVPERKLTLRGSVWMA